MNRNASLLLVLHAPWLYLLDKRCSYSLLNIHLSRKSCLFQPAASPIRLLEPCMTDTVSRIDVTLNYNADGKQPIINTFTDEIVADHKDIKHYQSEEKAILSELEQLEKEVRAILSLSRISGLTCLYIAQAFESPRRSASSQTER